MVYLALFGCAPVCPDPQSTLNGRSWDVFVNAVEAVVQTVQGDAGSFPAYQTPGNGESTWRIDWGSDEWTDSPLSVDIDGQTLAGEGTWSESSCGDFELAFTGLFIVADRSDHALEVSGDLQTYEDRIEGTLEWTELWSTGEAAGTYTGTLQLFGEETAAFEVR
jgi:hypothetical protein